jgi:hypothetical protein
MQTYSVSWEIDIDADSPREAAEKARAIQLREGSIATVFMVFNDRGDGVQVDLLEEDDSDEA